MRRHGTRKTFHTPNRVKMKFKNELIKPKRSLKAFIIIGEKIFSFPFAWNVFLGFI